MISFVVMIIVELVVVAIIEICDAVKHKSKKRKPKKDTASTADELLKLKSLPDAGVITQKEFDKLKTDLIK